MAKNINSSCDACGTVLFGKDRGAFVKKDNIFINGQVGKNVFDPNTKFHETIFHTRTKNEQLAFCNTDCLRDWMDTEEQLWRNRQLAGLRERAGGEANERLETGGYLKNRKPYEQDKGAYDFGGFGRG